MEKQELNLIADGDDIFVEEQVEMNEVAGTWGSAGCFGSASTIGSCASSSSSASSASSFS